MAVQYVLLPVLAQSLGLSYSQIGLLKACSSTAMALLEIPSGFLAERFGEKKLLIVGLIGTGTGYIGVAASSQFITACLFFLLAGCGAAFQHSLSSSLLVRTFEGGLRRKALGSYNAFGDLGKLAYAGAFSILLGVGLAWQTVVISLAISALAFAALVWWLLRRIKHSNSLPESENSTLTSNPDQSTWGITSPIQFSSLSMIVFLDSMVQAGFLTFIAFILIENGASAAHASGGVVLTLIGGTAGKFAGGWLAARIGDRLSFMLVQGCTIAGLLGVLLLPLQLVYVLLPLVGVFVQGSSTVCYGAVADYVNDNKSSRAYAIIYTLSSSASVAGPFFLGILADNSHIDNVLWLLMAITAVTFAFGLSFSGRQSISRDQS